VASDEHCLGTELGESGVRGGGLEPAIERDLAWSDTQAGELRDGRGQQCVLARVADLMRGRQDQPQGTRSRVLGHLRQLRDVPELRHLFRYPNR
jgi:hypothetical protein